MHRRSQSQKRVFLVDAFDYIVLANGKTFMKNALKRARRTTCSQGIRTAQLSSNYWIIPRHSIYEIKMLCIFLIWARSVGRCWSWCDLIHDQAACKQDALRCCIGAGIALLFMLSFSTIKFCAVVQFLVFHAADNSASSALLFSFIICKVYWIL